MTAASAAAGRVVIVTGGAHGIGEVVAERLSRLGWTVVVADVAERQAQAVADNVRAVGRAVSSETVDVTREGEVAALIESTIETHGRLDALVCSAAVHQRASIVDCSDDDWQQMLDVNVKGPFLCMKHALVHLAATGDGAVVLIGTAPDTAGAPDDAPYRATKAALVELARQAALEHEADAVRVNLVAPASTSADVADTVAFLLSDGARNISGAVVPVGVTGARGRG